MNGRRWLLALAILGAVASQALPAEPRAPKRQPIDYGSTQTWVVSTSLEVIGAAFPTLPEPYVSVELRTVAALDGAQPDQDARSVTNQRVTLSVAEAAALRDALDAWLANPTTTTTLAAKAY